MTMSGIMEVADGLPLSFAPEENTIDVRLGQAVAVSYKVSNQAARATVGQASYNVSPPTIPNRTDSAGLRSLTQHASRRRR